MSDPSGMLTCLLFAGTLALVLGLGRFVAWCLEHEEPPVK